MRSIGERVEHKEEGGIGRQNWEAKLGGKIGRQNWEEKLGGKIGRQTEAKVVGESLRNRAAKIVTKLRSLISVAHCVCKFGS